MAKLISLNNILGTLSTLLVFIPNAYPSKLVITPYERFPICQGPQTSSKIQFYGHLIYSGPNQSVYQVANSSITDTSPTRFGEALVEDVKLTCGPDYNSQQVGRAQGGMVSSDLRMLAFSLNFKFYFTSGEYNGSTIVVLGRFAPAEEYREFSVVGGTGTFRCARGHVISRTYSTTTNYDVYHIDTYVDYACGA